MSWQNPTVEKVNMTDQQIARHKEIIADLSKNIDSLKSDIKDLEVKKSDFLNQISQLSVKADAIISEASGKAAAIIAEANKSADETRKIAKGALETVEKREGELNDNKEKHQKNVALLNEKESLLQSKIDLVDIEKAKLADANLNIESLKKSIIDRDNVSKDLKEGLEVEATEALKRSHDLDVKEKELNEKEIDISNQFVDINRSESALSVERSSLQKMSDDAFRALAEAKKLNALVDAQKVEINKRMIIANEKMETANSQIQKAQIEMASIDEHKQVLIKLIDEYNEKTGGSK